MGGQRNEYIGLFTLLSLRPTNLILEMQKLYFPKYSLLTNLSSFHTAKIISDIVLINMFTGNVDKT